MPKTFRPEEVRRTSAALALLSCCALLLASSASRAASGATGGKSPAFEFKSAQKNQAQPARKGQAAAAPRVPEATLTSASS